MDSLLGSATGLVLAFSVATSADAGMAATSGLAESLRSNQRATQDAAHASLLTVVSDHRQLVEALIDIVREGTASEERSKRHAALLAMDILGKLKAAEATGVLADGLKFEEQENPFAVADLAKNVFPAMGALVKIGLPALTELRRRLSWELPSDLLEDLAYVMLEIDFRLGSQYLREFLRTAPQNAGVEPVEKKCKSLERLIERMEEYKKHSGKIAACPSSWHAVPARRPVHAVERQETAAGGRTTVQKSVEGHTGSSGAIDGWLDEPKGCVPPTPQTPCH